jgi:reductive dehalogenase
MDRLIKLAMDNKKQWIEQNKNGYTLKDLALLTGANFGWFDGFSKSWTGEAQTSPISNLGGGENAMSDVFYLNFGVDGTEARPGTPSALCVPTPAYPIGSHAVPKYQGSPEENLRMLRAAARFYGANMIGVQEMDANHKKMLWARDWDGKRFVFEDIDEAYETGPWTLGTPDVGVQYKRAVPNKCRYYITIAQLMSDWNIKRAPTLLGDATTAENYSRVHYAQVRIQRFLRMLGYQGLATFMFINNTSANPGNAVLSGIAEQGRIGQAVSPEYGSLVRLAGLITDLPLAPTKPIDSGIWKFCEVCKKCMENCPPLALDPDDEPTWEVKGTWNAPGKKCTWLDGVKCASFWYETSTLCGICIASCPWSRQNKSWVHDYLVKPSIATTTVFNSFFRSMDDFFGYAYSNYDYQTQIACTERDPEKWWEYQDLPIYGIFDTK